MKTTNSNQKFKGLVNGKNWKAGTLKLYDGDLTAICRNGKDFYVFKDSVSSFTGFVNAWGEEIYEGDLLAVNSDKKTAINVVFWDKVSQQWTLGLHGGYDVLLSSPLEDNLELSVVGHAFTHCHLLEPSRAYYELSSI